MAQCAIDLQVDVRTVNENGKRQERDMIDIRRQIDSLVDEAS